MLRIEISELTDACFDVSLLGFSDEELALMAPEQVEGLTDEDAVPDVPEVPVTVPGDVWLLGAHFECSECKKQFSYAEGLPFKDDGCPCGKA